MTISTFTGSAVGTPNPVTVPADYKGEKQAEIVPPLGHAWMSFDPSGKNSVSRATDQTLIIKRGNLGQAGFAAGEIIASVNLDTGSGTFTVLWT